MRTKMYSGPNLSSVTANSLGLSSSVEYYIAAQKHKKREEEQAAIELEIAKRNNIYVNTPTALPTYHYGPRVFQPLFSTQRELGKPVVDGKTYTNIFFDNLASVNYFHTYISGYLTCRLHGGLGRQFTTGEKKKYKTYVDGDELYQYHEGQKIYIADGDYRYVVSPKGGLYIISDYSDDVFHNSIRGSQPVQCAGAVEISDGRITKISNESGHYRPTKAQLLRTLGGLYAAKFIDSETRVRCFTVTGFMSSSTENIGTIGTLIRSNDIWMPTPWQATQDICARMSARS